MTDFEIIPRAEWGALPPKSAYSPMTQADGWVVHWVGAPCQQDPSLPQSKALVYNLQEGAFNGANGENYIDIPYNFLIDLNGRIFEGRGWANKSGANGSTNYNAHAWAVCILSGPGNTLTQEAKDALAWLTQEGARRVAAVSYVKGHRDVYATQCPGDEAYAYVPYLNAHLHDAEAPPVDWAALAALVKLEQDVTAKPLKWKTHDPNVKPVKELLQKHGYDKVGLEHDPTYYGDDMKRAVRDWKLKHASLANKDGKVCGGPCVHSLITEK